MGKIKGWKKTYEKDYALGKTEEWTNQYTGKTIVLEGVIGTYGSRDFMLTIPNFEQINSSNRIMLKNRAIRYMRSHPRG